MSEDKDNNKPSTWWSWAVKRVHQADHLLNTIGGATVLVGTVAGVISYALGNYTTLYPYIQSIYRPETITFFTGFLFFGFGISVVFNFTIRKNYKKKDEKLRALEKTLERYRAPEQHFRAWASENADCDKILFDKLFNENSSSPVSRESLVVSIQVVTDNILKTIDYASLILSEYTGAPCSSAFEILQSDSGKDNWYLWAPKNWRDLRSREGRAHLDQQKHFLTNGSVWGDIIDGSKRCYSNDGVRNNHTLVNDNRFVNQSVTSLIICGVHRLNRVTESKPYLGVLIIDSQKVGLANPTAEHYVRELSYRLAVMAYRLDMLVSHANVRTLEVKK